MPVQLKFPKENVHYNKVVVINALEAMSPENLDQNKVIVWGALDSLTPEQLSATAEVFARLLPPPDPEDILTEEELKRFAEDDFADESYVSRRHLALA